MSDAALVWGGDFRSSSTGDIALCSGESLAQQRLLRRLLTNQGDYLWQPSYGAGLGQFVGSTRDAAAIKAKIRSQIFLESLVARLPEPTIDVGGSLDGGVFVRISYVDSSNGSSQLLSFSVDS